LLNLKICMWDRRQHELSPQTTVITLSYTSSGF
jgi:hypothetical protein